MEITIDKKECRICENCLAAQHCPQLIVRGEDGIPYLTKPLPDDDRVFMGILKAMTSCPGGCIKMS
ncbi:MAG: ferredoxin [Anaerolineales bacterium]|nr:ferredoxin [Anaerolineales bacterium]